MIDEIFKAWRDSLATKENLDVTSEQLFAALRTYARSIVYNTLRKDDPQLVQDIVTNAFLKAATFQGTASFGTWFYRLAYNQCMQDLRLRRQRKEVFLDDILLEPLVHHQTSTDLLDRLAHLKTHLTRRECQVIDWRLEGYTVAEIGAKLGEESGGYQAEWLALKRKCRKLLETAEDSSDASS